MIFLVELHLMQSQSNMKKAEISIYLALTLGIVLSLVLTLVEGARQSAIKMQIECVTDMGLHSVFAEYHRELLSQYDLFFIDTSYGREFPSLANTEQHLNSFMEYNFNPAMLLFTFQVKDWLSIYTQNLSFSEYSIATDEKGNVVKRQILQYMRDKYLINDFIQANENKRLVTDNHLHETNISSEKQRLRDQINAEMSERNIRENEDNTDNTVEIPSDQVNQVKGMSLIPYIITSQEKVSRKLINPTEYVSGRELLIGTGIPKIHQEDFNAQDEIFIGEYLIEKCGYYLKEKEKSNAVLKYQLEYILAGKGNDYDNLSLIANRLLLMREASNMMYLWSNSAKSAEAETAAAMISAIALIPEAEPAIKQLILLTWATAESICDLKVLYKGGKVPIMKSDQTWQLSFLQFCLGVTSSDQNQRNSTGQGYLDYLRILLLMQSPEEKMMRFFDVMEMDIRNTEDNENFQLDGCLDSLTMEAIFKSHYGYQYSIKRFYSYE